MPALPACGEFGLQFGKVGAFLMDDHHLAVDDRFAPNGERAGNLGKAFGPIQPVAGKHLLSPAVKMDLDAIAVELDFVKLLLAVGRPELQRRENEPPAWLKHALAITQLTKSPPHLGGNGGHLTYFLPIPNNQGTSSLLLPPMLYGHARTVGRLFAFTPSYLYPAPTTAAALPTQALTR